MVRALSRTGYQAAFFDERGVVRNKVLVVYTRSAIHELFNHSHQGDKEERQ